MSGIGRLQAALTAATNEITVAAANINFDFTLVKYEAPQEFQPLGPLLSRRRKEEAEGGQCHVTARRLSALFAPILPKTPTLISVYGKRAAEIGESASSELTKHHLSSIFSQFAGVDATSLWAAATSNEGADGGALHVHLLACLLASMWDRSKATSIWVEIVEERRQEIIRQFDRGDEVHFATATAATQHQISRDQLAEWDASARSWLETADGVKRNSQIQLNLILKNISSSLGTRSTLYPSILGIWESSLTIMDNLVSGISQEVHDASAIIGLRAWHIYPEIHLFGAKSIQVKFGDQLVPSSGVLTLGCSRSPTSPTSGITWSLSLSTLRYYGTPVDTNANISETSNRLTADEFRIALLGCVLRVWGVDARTELAMISTLTALSELVYQQRQAAFSTALPFTGRDNTWKLLRDAAKFYLDQRATGSIVNLEACLSLGKNSLECRPSEESTEDDKKNLQSFAETLDMSSFMACLSRARDRIYTLKRWARQAEELRNKALIIRYLADTHEFEYFRYSPDSDATEDLDTFPPGDLVDPADVIVQDKVSTSANSTEQPKNHSTDNSNVHKPSDELQDDSHTDDSFTFRINGVSYKQVFGNISLAGVFIDETQHVNTAFQCTRDDVSRAAGQGIFHVPIDIFKEQLLKKSLYDWLNPFALALKGIEPFKGAIIGLYPLRKRSSSLHWVASMKKCSAGIGEVSLTKAGILAVLSYFTAGCDVSDSDLANATGLSYGDSLYVASELLDDPATSVRSKCSRGITRLLGNIGQPGLVAFSSVENPIEGSTDDTNWRITENKLFDGKPDDLFTSLSMHFGFTEWKRALSAPGSVGEKFIEFLRMESVTSIRDRGVWVGDVDISSALRNGHIFLAPHSTSCNHSPPSPATIKAQCEERNILVTEGWSEVTQRRWGLSVIQCHGNRQARLAVAVFLAQRQSRQKVSLGRIVILEEDSCWSCLMLLKDYNAVFIL